MEGDKKGTGSSAGSNIEIKSELEWIRFREETLGPAAYAESSGPKLFRKIKENPLVPIGALLTLSALTYGLWCFRQGRGQASQNMMRARIGAQGFTIVAILGGVVMGGYKDSSWRTEAEKSKSDQPPT